MQTDEPSNEKKPLDDETAELNRKHDRKRLIWQIIIFTLVYCSYFALHIYRQMWSVCRPEIINNPAYHISRENLSDIDTANFFVYGLSQFIIGSVGDKFKLNIVMPLTYVI